MSSATAARDGLDSVRGQVPSHPRARSMVTAVITTAPAAATTRNDVAELSAAALAERGSPRPHSGPDATWLYSVVPTALATAGLSATTGSYAAVGTAAARLGAAAVAAAVVTVAIFRAMSTLAIVA